MSLYHSFVSSFISRWRCLWRLLNSCTTDLQSAQTLIAPDIEIILSPLDDSYHSHSLPHNMHFIYSTFQISSLPHPIHITNTNLSPSSTHSSTYSHSPSLIQFSHTISFISITRLSLIFHQSSRSPKYINPLIQHYQSLTLLPSHSKKKLKTPPLNLLPRN